MNKYSGEVPSGSDTPVITHDLDTLDVIVQLYNVSGEHREGLMTAWTVLDENNVRLRFHKPAEEGEYAVVVIG